MQDKIYKYFDLNPNLHVLFVFSLETKAELREVQRGLVQYQI